ncbi:MAG: 50S ribosomal protein L11 methyltransferase [Novosphingobium sp.]|nr:50S ribosomal protein L11 methyltransferase [Novosphingobium sp.]
MSWKLTVEAPRAAIEAALLRHEDATDWEPDIVIAGSEVCEDRPDDWRLEAWLPNEPSRDDRAALDALFGTEQDWRVEQLPETDWLTASQSGLAPIRAGRFYVHTPDQPADPDPAVRSFAIPAGQAFGTGQHATTAGCLAMLSAIRASGAVVRNCADIGTGTGLLAFAVLHLWPRALVTASDVDPVCATVVAANAMRNGIAVGANPGELTMTVAAGLDHPLLIARAPYALIAANILAGPLVELMPAFAGVTAPGGHLLLAGLLTSQEAAVRRTATRYGFRLACREVSGDWSILWFRRRAAR